MHTKIRLPLPLRSITLLTSLLALSGCGTRNATPPVSSGGSVLDLFPASGVAQRPGKASCNFDYSPSGSTWHKAVQEKQVFLASVKSEDWQLGVGKGGHIYSLIGPYGESVPPQRPTSPWNDEVWQTVVTAEDVIIPIQDYQNAAPKEEHAKRYYASEPLMYFIHQAGIYTKGADPQNMSAAAPFYSPCLAKRWNPETRTLELVNWMQQAHTPCVWKSSVLIYTAYRDLGDGILEVNKVMHNFGPEKLTFLNAPWGGIRHSSMPHTIISNPDGSWENAPGVYGWTDIPTRHLIDSGGAFAWTRDPNKADSPSLALVFGRDLNDVSNGKRKDEAFRWGMAGTGEAAKVRDYHVAERMGHPHLTKGDSWSIRWYLVSGELAKVKAEALKLSEKSGIWPIEFDGSILQSVWSNGGKLSTEGSGTPWASFFAFPVEGAVPVFLLEDQRNGEQLITTDPYALAETEDYPNPLPADFEGRELYENRVIYKQYAPHIHYKALLGYAYLGEGNDTQPLPETPAGVRVHESAKMLRVQ